MNTMQPKRRQRGVTLIELMVGMVIGMLAVLMITQVMAVVEGQKRSATEGSDAQTNGALALYTLQRDVQGAGYGIVNTALNAIGCPIRSSFNGTNLPTIDMNPVTIVDGGADNGAAQPDRIAFNASSRNGVSGTRITVDHPPQAANFFVQSALGVHQGDLLVAVPPTFDSNNWCTVINASVEPGSSQGQGQGQGQNQINHNPGANGPWNNPGGQNIFPPGGYPAGSTLINLGQWVNKEYSVSSARMLQLSQFNSPTPTVRTVTDLFPEIVNLQALYGKDTDGDGDIDVFDSTTPSTNAEWRRVIAVRIAILARSAQFERGDVIRTDGVDSSAASVTTAQPVWDLGDSPAIASSVAGVADCGTSKCMTLRVNHLPDWRRYRYKLFDVVVPLRNVMWGS